MKIEIHNDGEGYKLYLQGAQFPIKNFRRDFIRPFDFYDDDIANLIGQKAFDTTFQNGKYLYNVSKSHLQLITGERLAQNRQELQLYKD